MRGIEAAATLLKSANGGNVEPRKTSLWRQSPTRIADRVPPPSLPRPHFQLIRR
jgi:hypothetical protein